MSESSKMKNENVAIIHPRFKIEIESILFFSQCVDVTSTCLPDVYGLLALFWLAFFVFGWLLCHVTFSK